MPPFDFVGPYELGDKLGQGGMGSVYRAVHAKTKQPVAVKIIAAQVADEPRFRRRFDAEIKTLMTLKHPRIVKLVGFGEEYGQLFYSMELVEGVSLQSFIKQEKKLSWQKCIDFTIEICDALKHAHDIGVIHRDLKPANLIVDGDQHLKLVDFGIAKIFGDGQQTAVGSMLGTLEYMAPEQIDNSSITVRTDLYAVGSVMYAMLAGRPPFRGKNAGQVIDLLKNQPAARLDLIDPDLPEPIVELIHELLEKSPEHRPPTALSVSKRLKAMRAGLEKMRSSVGGTQVAISSDVTDGNTLEVSSETAATPITQPVENNGAVSGGISSPSVHPGSISHAISDATKAGQDPDSNLTLGQGDLTLRNESHAIDVHGCRSQDAANTHVAQTVRTSNSGSIEPDLEPERHTHFQEAEFARQNESRRESSEALNKRWPQQLGIAAMVVILLAGATLLFQAMQPPSADELYQQTQLPNSSSAQRAFVKNFPDDPRRVQVEDRLMLEKIEAATKRISAQNKIGIKELSAGELAFLKVFSSSSAKGNAQDVSDRLGSINDWLISFGSDESGGDLKELIDLVRYEESRITSGRPDPRIDPRLSDLMKEVDAISDDAVDRDEKLESLINLFQSENWAEAAIKRAQERLGEVERDGN